MNHYHVFIVKKANRRRHLATRTMLVGFTESVHAAVSMATGIKEIFGVPAFVADGARPRPTLVGRDAMKAESGW